MSKKQYVVLSGVAAFIAINFSFIAGMVLTNEANAQDAGLEVEGNIEIEKDKIREFTGKGHRGFKGGFIMDHPGASNLLEYLELDEETMKNLFMEGITLEEYINENGYSLEEAKQIAKNEAMQNLNTVLDEEIIDQEKYDSMVENLDEIIDKMFTMEKPEGRGSKIREEMKERFKDRFEQYKEGAGIEQNTYQNV